MDQVEKRIAIRSGLRTAAQDGHVFWGTGQLYSTIHTCVTAILNMYWQEATQAE